MFNKNYLLYTKVTLMHYTLKLIPSEAWWIWLRTEESHVMRYHIMGPLNSVDIIMVQLF